MQQIRLSRAPQHNKPIPQIGEFWEYDYSRAPRTVVLITKVEGGRVWWRTLPGQSTAKGTGEGGDYILMGWLLTEGRPFRGTITVSNGE